MPLDREARLRILNRALALESRSFLEYMAHTAQPVDIERYPEIERALGEMVKEEDAIVDALVAAIAAEGANPDLTITYDMKYTYYNFVTTEYSLRVIQEQLEKGLARFDALVDEAAADAGLYDILRPVRDRKAAIIARVAELRRTLRSGEPAGRPSAKPPAPAHH